MKKIFFLLALFSLSFSYYYIYLVDANTHSITNLVYDDNSTSYADNSLENPDAELRLCADTAAELQGKWVSMAYADGTNPGDYIEITHHPLQITSVPPTNCIYLPIDISSFKAWYPSIPFVFISNSTDLSAAQREKMITSNGWLQGNYTVSSTQTGDNVNITVTDALDDAGNSIVPDVDFLVVGLVQDGTLITTDTAITSVDDPAVLSLGGYSGNYYIHVNGIGPGEFGPQVTIITPEPTTYSTSQVPFTYMINSYYPIGSCWYVLDGNRVDMPNCVSPYILDVSGGTHTLVLYAEDTLGQVDSDSVTFNVEEEPPHPWGPGGPHVGIPPEEEPKPPYVPPPPPGYFSINPEQIDIIVNYPLEGEANFTLYSTSELTDVSCFVSSDFEKYTTVELESETILPNSTIDGTIIVDMPPEDILEYNDGGEGVLQCVGKSVGGPSLMLSTAADIYLTVNKPWLEAEEEKLSLFPGEHEILSLNLTNTGNGTAYLYNTTIDFQGPYAGLVMVLGIPTPIEHGETKELPLLLSIPSDYEPGTYYLPFNMYESGRLVGSGVLEVVVGKAAAAPACRFPVLLNIFTFSDMVIPWLLILFLAYLNWRLIRKYRRMTNSEKTFLSILPALLALPGIWIFNPCFMMNISLLQFMVLLLRWMKKEYDKRKRGEAIQGKYSEEGEFRPE
ncbi:hypothetical protein GF415_01080 [Candidatus Micrarchaeota archaeon]|nr:hypothetical protein [Candidatus Micrarchaeota archaeon]